jgi:hypothetical protein
VQINTVEVVSTDSTVARADLQITVFCAVKLAFISGLKLKEGLGLSRA